MQIGDNVRHVNKGWLGVIYEIGKYGYLVNWSDDFGVRFRVSSGKDLEAID
jgi:hypothetical protein